MTSEKIELNERETKILTSLCERTLAEGCNCPKTHKIPTVDNDFTLSQINGLLEMGHYLILNPVMHEYVVPMMKTAGFSEKAMEQVYKTEKLPRDI